MPKNKEMVKSLFKSTAMKEGILDDPEVAHLFIHKNQVVGEKALPGLEIETDEFDKGVNINVLLEKGNKIKKPVHMCFGVMPEKGIQEINLKVKIEDNSAISILAHCTFPFAEDVIHKMQADIEVGKNSQYSYYERHIHGQYGGIKVYPKAKIELRKGASFNTEFELLKGRVGLIDIDYETTCREKSKMEMTARIDGRGNDKIKIREIGNLTGEHSRGVLTSRVALRDRATADVYNELTASAPYARGHVDCKEIIQDNGIAKAVPVVTVKDPKAHVTHEAAIGSVDSKQLQTLMSRGLTEDEAVNLIIQGLLS
ncbi:MAG: SufB/SufD family protein [Elusimicrobiota bacterium]